MNTMGRLFRLEIFGESHGESVGIIIDGCPPGIPLAEEDFHRDIERRKGGGSGTTSRVEEDIPRVHSGVYRGFTTGSPILISFLNRDADSGPYEKLKDIPRPGHGDFTARMKYRGFNDSRGGGHLSGRITAGLTAAGVIAKKIIQPAKIEARILEIGGHKDYGSLLEKAVNEGDSLGGIIECMVKDLPAGLGEPFFDSAESLLSHIIFAIPGIKGIEFGAGFRCSIMRGSDFNDPVIDIEGRTSSNNSGGINAGITSGNPVVFRVAVRPTPSIYKVQDTVNFRTGKTEKLQLKGRHDACFCLRLPVVVESAAAAVLADLFLINRLYRD